MLVISVIALVCIFFLNVSFGMYYGFGNRHYWFFEILHFLGGFFVAMFFSNFFRSAIFIFTGLGIVTILWESTEILIAKIPVLSNFVKKKLRQKDVKPKLSDTILDIILNFTGAIVFFWYRSF